MGEPHDAGETAGRTDAFAASEPGEMRARRWTIAATFNEPADYDIPPLPEWTVHREAGGALALGTAEGDGVFIAADDPVRVRR